MPSKPGNAWLVAGVLAILAAAVVFSGKASRPSGSYESPAAIGSPSTSSSRSPRSSLPETPRPRYGNSSRDDLAAALKDRDADKAIRLLTDLTPSDPAAIAALVLTGADPAIRVDALRTVAREWAALDPAKAMAWAQALPDEDEREDVSEFVCYRVAEDDPLKAREMAVAAGFGPDSSLSTDLVQQWAAREPAKARDWVLSQPPGDSREILLTELAPLLAQQDPAAAGRIVSEELTGSHQEEAAMSVLYQWARKDAGAATAWVQQFPQGALKKRAEEELQGILAMEDEEE